MGLHKNPLCSSKTKRAGEGATRVRVHKCGTVGKYLENHPFAGMASEIGTVPKIDNSDSRPWADSYKTLSNWQAALVWMILVTRTRDKQVSQAVAPELFGTHHYQESPNLTWRPDLPAEDFRDGHRLVRESTARRSILQTASTWSSQRMVECFSRFHTKARKGFIGSTRSRLSYRKEASRVRVADSQRLEKKFFQFRRGNKESDITNL